MTPESTSSFPQDETNTIFTVLLFLAAFFILVGIGLFAWELIVDYKMGSPGAIGFFLPG